MAANQLRAMYLRIGYTNGADDNIVDVQGIDSVRELGYLNDEDVINLCKTIRRPGGHLPNPAYVARGNMAAAIPYTGIMVSQRAETNSEALSSNQQSCHHAHYEPNLYQATQGTQDQGGQTRGKSPLSPYHRPEELAQDHRCDPRLLQLYSW